MSREKSANDWSAKYFRPHEVKCKCQRDECDAVPVSPNLLMILDEIREAWGKPIIVTSGSRCKPHNKAVGGVEKSRHLSGLAVDVAIPQEHMLQFAALCQAKGITGIGLAKGWMHLERIRGKFRCWFY